MNQDLEQLKLLSIFHYVVGGLMALFALFPIIHLVVGLIFLLVPLNSNSGEAPPRIIGWIFVILATSFIAIGWTIAALIIAAGRCLAKRKHYLFCLVIAGLECAFMPIGTALGVFTIIVLVRESVKREFLGTPAA